MTVDIYTKTTCIFCDKAKAWFRDHGIPFQEHDAGTTQGFAALQERVPNAVTVPQIILDGHVIGGWDVLKAHEEPILAKLRTAYPAA